MKQHLNGILTLFKRCLNGILLYDGVAVEASA